MDNLKIFEVFIFSLIMVLDAIFSYPFTLFFILAVV